MGTSFSSLSIRGTLRDHPHAYGDKETAKYCVKSEDRIIPTRMGTRQRYFDKRRRNRDHPHAYGDKGDKKSLVRVAMGSSPRVWGQAVLVNAVKAYPGIIPTRVGTSDMFVASSLSCRDHPHACGDKGILLSRVSRVRGSSPRVWGQGQDMDIAYPLGRIIPTRVGTRN